MKLTLLLTSAILIVTSCTMEPKKLYTVEALSSIGEMCRDSSDRIALTEFHKQNLASIKQLTLSGDDQDYDDVIQRSIQMSIDAVCPTYYAIYVCTKTDQVPVSNPSMYTYCIKTNKITKEVIVK